MNEHGNKSQLPRMMWHIYWRETVEVLRTGHFPDTAIVRRSNGLETETYVNHLQEQR